MGVVRVGEDPLQMRGRVMQVEARYRGRWNWFQAVVTAVRPSGYDIRYDDGESESNVHRALLRQVFGHLAFGIGTALGGGII